ncbi:MAG TPA: acyl-CoA desaturase [Planctomycetes bacterium]|nr:acyl-CoA desaturase [Planctomycetota bacterium]
MLAKTALIFAWALASYALLLGWAATWAVAAPLSVSLGLALAAIGFSVMHDGGHRSYSRNSKTNRWAALALDFLGGSSYVWRFKHNVLHHSYPNVEGADDDIEFLPFLRLSPGQPRYWFHRFQFLYWPFLLLFLAPKWIFLDDFVAVARGEVGGHPLPRLGSKDWVTLFLGKLCFALWAIALPLLFLEPLPYLIGSAIVFGVQGFTLGLVFQLAHAVEGASFFPPAASDTLPWAEHQLATTVDFARKNPLLSWFVGGLNFQIEHHLFPQISHRHYPALAEVVREVCERHQIRVLEQPTLGGALAAHVRHLYQLGCPLEAADSTQPRMRAEPQRLTLET